MNEDNLKYLSRDNYQKNQNQKELFFHSRMLIFYNQEEDRLESEVSGIRQEVFNILFVIVVRIFLLNIFLCV